jgi:hypothetical protein
VISYIRRFGGRELRNSVKFWHSISLLSEEVGVTNLQLVMRAVGTVTCSGYDAITSNYALSTS